jgi:hypothetical protein
VGAKGLCLAGPPRSGEISRPDLRDPVASGVKCGPHGGKKSKKKSFFDRSRCRVAAHDRSLHVGFAVVHQNCRVTWLSHKTKTGGSAGRDGIRACREASMLADAWRDRRAYV